MKTPRRSSKVVTDTAPVTGIPVSDAKALFDAVSQDNTKHITLGVPTEVVRQAPIRALGETEVSDHFTQLPEGVASGLLDQEDPQNEAPEDVTTDQLVNQAVNQMNAEEIDFDALLEQGTAMMEELIAGIDPSGPVIPGTIEMDIEQDDGSIKHHVFDNPDRPYHMAAMAQCDALIKQYDQQRLEQATKPPVKPLRLGWFSWL